MRSSSPKNKLIILLNLSGSYKGGAQRRYLALFKYLQQISKNDYFLLLNDALYRECFKDHILTDSKNIISIPVKYGQKVSPKVKDILLNKSADLKTDLKQRSGLYNFL